MKIEEPDLSGRYTYADYLTWRMDEMVELIQGKIYKMSPAPGSVHQKISGKCFLQSVIFYPKANANYFQHRSMYDYYPHRKVSPINRLLPWFNPIYV